MPAFNMNEADNYGGSNGGSFFTLKDDKDKARVRFLYRGVEDVKGYACHKVAVGDKDRYVNCLRAYNEPLDKCPFCAAQLKVTPRLFLSLYNEDAGEVQVWERSKAYFQRLASLSSRYNPLHDEIIEIERSGKKGDMQTTYEFYPIENVPTNLDDYDIPNPLGTIVLDKDADDMNFYLDNGSFPETESSSTTSSPRENLDQVQRRTPSNNPPRRAF